MRNQKQALRKEIARLKAEFKDSALKLAQSSTVLTALERHPAFQAASTVLLYYSLPDEVNTHAFVRKWSKSKKVVLPVVVGDELELRLFTGEQDLVKGSYGILEPAGCLFSDYEAIACIVVPGVAFDRRGHRLGRGKGYYDRLLPQLSHAYKIGVCFPFQLVPAVPTEESDIRMDAVIEVPQPEIHQKDK